LPEKARQIDCPVRWGTPWRVVQGADGFYVPRDQGGPLIVLRQHAPTWEFTHEWFHAVEDLALAQDEVLGWRAFYTLHPSWMPTPYGRENGEREAFAEAGRVWVEGERERWEVKRELVRLVGN
jgi:hypothetical protein